jgi:hypothetical protein
VAWAVAHGSDALALHAALGLALVVAAITEAVLTRGGIQAIPANRRLDWPFVATID